MALLNSIAIMNIIFAINDINIIYNILKYDYISFITSTIIQFK
jgi:hypothetical protein